MRIRTLLLCAVPMFATVVLVAVFASRLVTPEVGSAVPPSARIGEPLPSLDLPSLQTGGPGLRTDTLQGEPFLINIWAEWCGPCKIEHPRLMKLANDGIAVYGINYKDKDDRALEFLAKEGNPFRIIGADREGHAGLELGIYGVPETFVVDARGKIRHRIAGPISEHGLEKVLLPLLERLARDTSK